MLPISLFLFDLFLIQGATIENLRKKKNWAVCLFALLLVPAIGLVYYDFSSITGDYDKFRPFTMWERVLTQPRVILFYISLLLYPITSRMMFIHDMEISKSFFDPWTTFAAVVVLLLILIVAVLISRKRPLISYCIIFFLLNHLIEGSFISLGLVYEHRNYLPSMLFFVPLSIFVVYALSYFEKRKRMILVLSSAITAIIIIMGVSVYIYNDILKDEISFWSDNAEKAPRLAIVHNNLGAAYLTAGRLSDALTELTKATESSNREHAGVEYMTFRLLGYYYTVNRDDERALSYTRKALAGFPSDAELYNQLAVILIRKKNLKEAESEMKKAIALRKNQASFHINLGKIYLLQGNPDAAIKEAQRGIFLDGSPLEAYWLISEAFKGKKDHKMSDHFGSLVPGFKQANRQCP
jgi:tetratricopeptide (TPR) repeat protein